MNRWPIKSWSILTAILCLIIVVLTVVSTLFTVKDLLYESLCAILGVVLTACVTVLLLRGQTDTETEKARKDKVFEEKLQIYKEFLNALCEALKDGVVTKEEYVQMQFQFATITMHTDLANANKISQSVYNIVNDLHDSKDGLSDKLMEELLNIVEVLRSELYENMAVMSDKDKDNLVFNFTELRGSFEDSTQESAPIATANDNKTEADTQAAMKAFVAKVNDSLQPWAKSANVKVEINNNVNPEWAGLSLRISSPEIGADSTKDYMAWGITGKETKITCWQLSIDRKKRREIYNGTKRLGYPAIFNTSWCATLFPKSREERHIIPATVGGKEYCGVLDRIVAQDAALVQSYADWIQNVYQKFVDIKGRV